MERRARIGLAAIAAVVVLTLGGVGVARFLREPAATDEEVVGVPSSPSLDPDDPSRSAAVDPLAPVRRSDRAPPSPRPPPPPPREGMVRYRARLVRSDGKPHSGFMSEAIPAGSSATQTLPPTADGEVFVDAPAECRSIDFSSRGFVTIRHAIRPREVDREELGAIVFEQAATLEVVLLHAPRHEKPWLEVWVRAKVEVPARWSDELGFGQVQLATPDGDARTTFFVPSETEIRIGLAGDGVRVHRVVAALEAGKNVCTIDFAELHPLRGRVAGIPAGYATGTAVWLQRFLPQQNGLFPGLDARTALDEQGCFLFHALPDGPFALRLDVGGLREAGGAHRDWWRTEELLPERVLELEPVDPLLGVEVGPIVELFPKESACSLQFDGPKPASLELRPAGERHVARGLIQEASLRSATHATLRIGGRRDGEGVRQVVVAVDRLPPPRDQVVAIRLDALKLPTASLTVWHNWFASRQWTLLLTASGSHPYSNECPITVTREHGLVSFTFSELEAGRYDVWGSRSACIFDRVVTGIDLGEGESASVRVELAEPARIEGRVTNWNDIPSPLRPREINVASSQTDIVDGHFSLVAVPPIRGKARFTGPHGLITAVDGDVVTLADGSLEVTCPMNQVEPFELTVSVPPDGQVTAFTSSFFPETIGLFDHTSRVSADSHGVITILRRHDETLRGWVTEYGADHAARVLAWFTTDAPIATVVPAGRFVEIENEADGTTATVLLVPRKVGDWQPPRLPMYKVITGMPRRMWLADAVEFVDVEFPGGPAQRFPAAAIGPHCAIAER